MIDCGGCIKPLDFDWFLRLHIFIAFSYFDTVFVRLCALTAFDSVVS